MFRDRTDAGSLLGELVASALAEPARGPGVEDAMVVGLPRGGVPIAAMVAQTLGAPLDVLVVRKIGAPWQPELALGAVGEHDAVVLNDDVVGALGLARPELDALIRKAAGEVEDVVAQLRPASSPLDVHDRHVIVCDDGVATGATARAAVDVLRGMGSGPVMLATPVAARPTVESLRSRFDEVIAVLTPLRLGSVGQFYEHFEQVDITRVRRLLEGSPD
jgi:putative phosphoribosyl transferase